MRSHRATPEGDGSALTADAPAILAQRVGNRRLVYAANPTAQAAGLRPGMAVAQAQALVPELSIRDAELGPDAEALDKLGLWALRLYSPLAAIDPPEGLIIDAIGAAHLHGGGKRHARPYGLAAFCLRYHCESCDGRYVGRGARLRARLIETNLRGAAR